MPFSIIPIALFDEQNLKHCIITPFPQNGKIVDTVLLDKTAYVLILADPNDSIIHAHFHIVPATVPLFSDPFEYVGTYKIENFQDKPLVIYSVIRILGDGDFGIHSKEYIATYGAEKSEEYKNRVLDQIKNENVADEDLRSKWDFAAWSDKTPESTENESESESDDGDATVG